MGRRKVDVAEEGNLAEAVRKYKCLYDKTCTAYKDKRAKINAWKCVDDELGLEDSAFSFFLLLCGDNRHYGKRH